MSRDVVRVRLNDGDVKRQTTGYGRLNSRARQYVNAQGVPFLHGRPRLPSVVGRALSTTHQLLPSEVRTLQDHRRSISVGSMAIVYDEPVGRDTKAGNAHL